MLAEKQCLIEKYAQDEAASVRSVVDLKNTIADLVVSERTAKRKYDELADEHSGMEKLLDEYNEKIGELEIKNKKLKNALDAATASL